MEYENCKYMTIDATRILAFQLKESAVSYKEWAKKEPSRYGKITLLPFDNAAAELIARQKGIPIIYNA